jgi:CBS domain-containing protein
MNTITQPTSGQRLLLAATTANDLMTTNPLSVQGNLTVRQATTFLVNKAFSAAPVIDEAGRPIGVLSQTDLLIHQKESLTGSPSSTEYYARDELTEEASPLVAAAIETLDLDETFVRDVMTPVVLSVSPETSAKKVIEQLLKQRVHRLFVVDETGVLVGVVSTVDVLKRLQPEDETCGAPEHHHKVAL